jgi:hypothetical protein
LPSKFLKAEAWGRKKITAIVYRQAPIAPQIGTACKQSEAENGLKTGAAAPGSVK